MKVLSGVLSGVFLMCILLPGQSPARGMCDRYSADDERMARTGAFDDSLRSPWRYNFALLSLFEEKVPAASGEPSKGWNWHRALGMGTIITALATVASGFTGPEGPHCGLAAISTAMAGATCVNGFWTYGNVFAAGDTRLTIHAVSGILSTVGFGTATALADGAPHGQVGIASGALFLVTVGVVYF
mgnify:CR=1 FL=1